MLNYSKSRGKFSPPPVNLQDLSRWLKVLSEPKRLPLDLIIQDVQCNCELGDKLGMAPNLISHHLSFLREVNGEISQLLGIIFVTFANHSTC
jgi:hypothetical protein